MPAPWSSAFARLASLGGATHALAAAAVVALTLAAVVVAILLQPSASALFATPLHPEQLEEVEERLASWNVPFTPSQDNVMVDPRRRNDLLLRLSLAGVPHTHLAGTDEALAAVGALTPQSVIDAQALDGRAGDIASALRDVAGVQDSRVIIAPARSGEFADESGSAASASVRLRLDPGVKLSADTVAGVRAFVAAAVAGLDPSHVTILDDRGVALGTARGGGDDSAELASALQSALDSAFGAGATIVRVRAEHEPASFERHDVTRVPLLGGAIEANASSRAYRRGDERYHEASEQSTRGSQTREVTSRVASGALTRISTAVFVDASHAGDLLAIRDLAAATVGYDARRGDTLAVQAIDFARLPPARKDAWWLLYGSIVPLLPTLACVGGAVIALRIAMPSLRAAAGALLERVRIAEAAKRAPEIPPAQLRALLASEPPHAAAAVISMLPAASAAAVLELYPPHERDAIVRRMHRTPPPLIPDPSELLRHG
ncbi:MAG TPA: flagellar M-ring protein FliF C-terminal domain-containing protein [Candidatus Tyrphobacter sp.]